MRAPGLALLLALLAAPATAVLPEPPGDPETAEAVRLLEGGREAMSLPLLQAVLARNPEDPDVLVYIALAQRRLGRPELAMDAYLRALAASPNHPAALAYQGSLYLEMGDRWRAEANYLQLTFSCGTCAEATTLARELAAAPR